LICWNRIYVQCYVRSCRHQDLQKRDQSILARKYSQEINCKGKKRIQGHAHDRSNTGQTYDPLRSVDNLKLYVGSHHTIWQTWGGAKHLLSR
jgi:hypothetical protein